MSNDEIFDVRSNLISMYDFAFHNGATQEMLDHIESDIALLEMELDVNGVAYPAWDCEEYFGNAR